MWFFIEKEDEDGDYLYAWSNSKPYYGKRSCYRRNRETNEWKFQEIITWRVGSRHNSYHVWNVDMSHLKNKLILEPIEFDLVVDGDPHWFVERVGDKLYVDYELKISINGNEYIRHNMCLRPSCLPEVREEDGIVGVRIVFKD